MSPSEAAEGLEGGTAGLSMLEIDALLGEAAAIIRAQAERERVLVGTLEDVEPVFAYLEADIEVAMDGGDEGPVEPCEGMDLCGHSFCAQTGCVSLRLAGIRAALSGPKP